ncbi:MAG: hybrid sensor histidine kinase/response regulator, partial [Ardenticatenaceae bacterium]
KRSFAQLRRDACSTQNEEAADANVLPIIFLELPRSRSHTMDKLMKPEATEIQFDLETANILIVDDNATNLGVIADYLEEYGFDVMAVRDGVEALELVRYAPVDLILLDVMMPGIDGFETCRRLKANFNTRDIPVIFMTALTSIEDKVKGFEVGAVDYITKPIQQAEVLARITTHLRLQNLTKSLQKQTVALQEMNQELTTTLKHLQATQKQLIESEKMAALGNLVAGVAHEINTPLGVGITAASTLDRETDFFINASKKGLKRAILTDYIHTARQSSHLILTNLRRAADLVDSFKQVAVDQTTVEKRYFYLKKYLKSILRSLGPKLSRHHVEINGDEKIRLYSYPGALSQVITNLVMNSLTHAYQQGQKGELRIQLTQQEQQLLITYADDGCGIPSKDLEKIFEPFFTTARQRGGTGLGLHIVYNLVTQKLGGTISCESIEGVGTKFVLILPLENKS